jgi:hypothetical protein
MTREIVLGTIVMEDRLAITQALDLENESFSGRWGMLKTIGASALELKVDAAGWRCFFLAGEVKATVFGSRALLNSQRALRRILKKVRRENFNCFEVTRIAGGHFCGIPYTTIGGHPRHLQQAWVLQDAKARLNAQTDPDWARG